MRIYDSIEEFPKDLPYPVMAIGVFDGVHRGHQAILRRLVERAREKAGTSVILSFHPHPQKVISPADAPLLLQTPRQKEAILESLQIDVLIKLPFNRRFSLLSPREFAHDILFKQGIREIYVGSNFRFGHRRSGDFDTLKRLGQEFGFEVYETEVVCFRGTRVSSTRIREVLRQGRVALARRLLCRPYQIRGTVVRGSGRGRDLGFPTANLHPENELIPATGIYATRVRVNGNRLVGATSIGYRPTFPQALPHVPVVETYILDFKGDIYGQALQLDFWFRLRGEKRFDSLEALVEKMNADIARIRRYWQKVLSSGKEGQACP